MGFLEENLRLLRRVDRSLARKIEATRVSGSYSVVPAKDGSSTLKVEGLSLHSTYDPQREAALQVREFIEKRGTTGLTFVLGLGFGYHVEKLLEAGVGPVILVEPDLEVFRIALENRNLKSIVEDCRGLFVGRRVEEIISNLEKRSIPVNQCRFFVHQPSMKRNREYYDWFVTKLSAKSILTDLRLNILVVPPIYGGSLPIARYCASAFKRLGHRVTSIDNSIYYQALKDIDRATSNTLHQKQLRGSLSQHLAERVMAKCLDLNPDLVFALAQAPLTPEILDRMRQFDLLTAFWFVEDFKEFPYWRQVASKYTHFFAIQKRGVFEELESLGDVDFHYLPPACDPHVHRRLRLREEERKRFGSEVSFVGAGYFNRQIFFQGLLDVDFKIWGTAWNLESPLGRMVQERGRRVSTRETVRIFNGSKINVNLHSSTYHKGINPCGDFVNPRTFEIASCAGFQLIDPRSHLPELFEPDREIACFESIGDLRQKISYYLSHPQERESIALRGQKRAREDHSYQRRMAKVLDVVVGKNASRFISLKEKVQTPDRLIGEAGKETELGQFLSRFRGEDRLTLEKIVSEIHRGEGRLTEPEVIFLLMHEFSKERKGYRWGM